MTGYTFSVTPTWIRLANNVLFLGTLFLALYIIIYPLAPEISYRLQPILKKVGLSYGNETDILQVLATKHKASEGARENLGPYPKDNVLVIPQIGVGGVVYDGKTSVTLNKGIWHRPKSSTPDKGGNTVLVAHRFLYTTGPNTFYHLDKLKVGDRFDLFWESKKYTYEVFDISSVKPTALEIENQTSEPILTLWTCTPIFSAKERLVVKAKLIPQL